MIEQEQINQAVDILRKAAKCRKIVLFGSYASGKADEESDIDLIVVEDAVSDIPGEIVRLLRVLSPLRLPVELLVVTTSDYEAWSDTPGNILFEAERSGKVLYEAA